MDKRTVSSAHERIDGIEKEVIAIKTEVKIQFKLDGQLNHKQIQKKKRKL
jgi:hypothetical protein